MKAKDKYDDYLQDKTTNMESDKITKDIISNYFQEEHLKERWGKILRDDHNYGQEENTAPMVSNTDASSNGGEKKNIRRLLVVTLIGIAASLLWFFNTNIGVNISPASPVDQLLSEHYAKPFTRDVLKGPDATLAIRSKAYTFYQNEAYKETIPLLENLIAEGAEEQEDYFFLGLSYLYTEQPEAGAKQFKTLLEGPTNNYQDIATWYLALALTDAGAYEEAKIYLSQVATWTGNKGKEKMANDAKDLMKVIDGIE